MEPTTVESGSATPDRPRRLVGRHAIVTGGASGIGAATVSRLFSEGASVTIADMDVTRGESLADHLDPRGERVKFVRTDIAVQRDCDNVVKATVAERGRLDIFVAGAAVLRPSRKIEPSHPRAGDAAGFISVLDVDEWRETLDINLTGTMLSVRAAASEMLQRAPVGGSIIVVASAGAVSPIASRGAYCVSKAGVWMLTKVLALELAEHGIRANVVAPGHVETPMTANVLDQSAYRQKILSGIPLKRFGRAEDIAASIAFLASDDSSFMTGKMLNPDGGVFTG